jgi:SAM-dependent methyltransferase
MRTTVRAMTAGLIRGESVARVLMNHALADKVISGKVVDVGGGRTPNYYQYLQATTGTNVEPVDASLTSIDFEKDPLPYNTGEVDTVVLCNVLEHIYNHQFLLGECYRILRPEGKLIGFVPFLVGYHPDPEDYFRYTGTALTRMLTEVGFTKVEVASVGRGPLIANLNTVILSVPSLLRPVLYLWTIFWDSLYLRLRPHMRSRTPLGYIFEAQK